jgi:magnesium chelatase family protein
VIARGQSFLLQGIDAVPCEVEADYVKAEMAKTTIVGLPDTAVRESMDRVRTAVLNSGFHYPRGRIMINLAPAHLRKEGPVYDLPIAVAILATGRTISQDNGETPPTLDEFLFAGELALDGRVRPVRGVVNLALLARSLHLRGLVVSRACAAEATVVEGIEVRGVEMLTDVVGLFNGTQAVEPCPPTDVDALLRRPGAGGRETRPDHRRGRWPQRPYAVSKRQVRLRTR